MSSNDVMMILIVIYISGGLFYALYLFHDGDKVDAILFKLILWPLIFVKRLIKEFQEEVWK